MRIVDAHTHFYPAFAANAPEEWAKSANEPYWGKLVGKRADGKLSLQGFPCEKKFLSDMDEAGVEIAVIQGWYWENAATCELMNAEISKLVKKHPDRLKAFAAIQIADSSSTTKILDRARDGGFCGIGEIHDGVQKFSYSGPEFEGFAAKAAELKLPVCIHLTEETPRQYPGKCETCNNAALDAARRFPEVDFIFAHWCGGRIFESCTEIEKLENAYFDSAASPLMYDNSAWDKGCAMRERAIFGSDYPIRLYPRKFKTEELRTIVETAKLHVPETARENFFHSNIERLFKL